MPRENILIKGIYRIQKEVTVLYNLTAKSEHKVFLFKKRVSHCTLENQSLRFFKANLKIINVKGWSMNKHVLGPSSHVSCN